MLRDEKNLVALKGASINAEKAFEAFHSKDYEHVPENERLAWAMAALIHCDTCRIIIALDECTTDGIARLLWMSDIISKLNEAKRWYFEKGIKLLLDISESNGVGKDVALTHINDIKAEYKIGKVEEYTKYRNKIGYHYDEDAIGLLKTFGDEDSEKFHELLNTFVLFSGEWAKLSKSIIQRDLK